MTHDELLAKVNQLDYLLGPEPSEDKAVQALRAVVELHKPELMISSSYCVACTINLETVIYPCPTIQAIEEAVRL